MILDWFRDFFQDDLNFLVSMCIGVAMAGRKLKKRPQFWIKLFLYALLIFGWSMAFHSGALGQRLVLVGSIKYVSAFLLTIIWVLGIYQCHPLTAVHCVTVAYCLEHIAQRSSSLIWTLLGITSWAVQKVMLYTMIFLVFLMGYRALLRNSSYSEEDARDEDPMMILIAFFVVLVDIVISLIMKEFYFQTGSLALLACGDITSVTVSLLALIVSVSKVRESAALREKKMIRQLLSQEQEKYAQEKAVAEMINIKCHDLKYQLEAFGERMNQEELDTISRAVDLYDSNFHTGNSTLDVVLTNKNLICQGKEIEFTCIADGAVLNFLREQDIYSLFSNLLDNAIEAAEKLPQKEGRVITLTVARRNYFVFVHMENACSGQTVFEDGLPRTTKEDSVSHGYGTTSIRYLAEKYGGDVRMQEEDGVFQVDIMIPIEERLN